MVSFGETLSALEAIAPLRHAEDWDNVGLLVEPERWVGARGRARAVRRVVLAIDATTAVLDEARRLRADLLVAYHPPIFAGLKRLCAREPRTRGLLAAVGAGLAIYSPHTALDATSGGVCDWLAMPFGRARSAPLRQLAGAPLGVGPGRRLDLAAPLSLAVVIRRLKRHLSVRALRVAGATSRPIRSIALVPGAGGSLLMPCVAGGDVDLLLTGELRHHDVLAAVEAGAAVVLAEHSQTERGYLRELAKVLRRALGTGVEVRVASADREPLRIV